MNTTSARELPTYPTPPDMLLTRHEEGSFVLMGAILKVKDRYYIVAVWRNKGAPSDMPWQLPTPHFLLQLKKAKPYRILMESQNLSHDQVLVPDEMIMAALIEQWSAGTLH